MYLQHHTPTALHIQSDLVYPNSFVPIQMCSDCKIYGLLNHCKWKMIEEVTRKCIRIVRHTDYRSTD